MRASTTGSLGTANGNLSMITQLNCSPGTSTPCQNDDVANSTEFGVDRNSSSSALRGEDLDDLARGCGGERGTARIGQILRHVEQGLLRIIEMTRDDERAGASQS